MDEGFTSYISAYAMAHINNQRTANPVSGSYRGYKYLATSGKEQPASTHADRYNENRAYGITAYSKGAVFLGQLGYVIGKQNLDATLKQYFKEWSFKHPTPNDFIRVAERVSGLELDWYLMDWTQTTNTIDYAVTDILINTGEGNTILLERKGLMPMPMDVRVTYGDGSTEDFYIPLQMMRGEKPSDGTPRTQVKDWAWAYPTYSFKTAKGKAVQKVQIDPSGFMADVDDKNNTMVLE
jgi:aminopeptidase N